MKSFVFLLCLFSVVAYGQGRRTFTIEDPTANEGKKLYQDGKYEEAIPQLEKALQSNANDADLNYYLGFSYYKTGQNQKSWDRLMQLKSIDANYNYWFYMVAATVGIELRKYDEAGTLIKEYKSRASKQNSDETRSLHRADYMINYITQAKALNQRPITMKEPVMLTSPVNSDQSDYLPMADPTGNKLYFTSDRLGGFYKESAGVKDGDEDLYYTVKVNNTWTEPQLMPAPLNSNGNDGAASFSADGQTMVFGACGRKDGVGSCDLYYATLEGDRWSLPMNMGNVVNSESWDAHSTLSADGTKIIFASNRSGTYGSEDLYMVEKNPFGEWGIPVNLGPTINTPFSELSPFLSQDGRTLYFASDGHPGFGGTDIFKSVFENGKWSTPVNLGKPLNTENDDRYFTIGGAGEVGYFSSDRNKQDMHLYEVEIPEDMRPQPTIVVEGIVTNAKNNTPVGAYVLVEDIVSGELIAVNKSNAVTGKYLVVLPAGRSYSVSANKEGFFFYSNRFDVSKESRFSEIKKDIPLKPIEKGAKVVLNNIFFETGKATLTAESRLELQKAVELMKMNPSMVIEVGGHTDNVGDDAMNMKLSHDRAKSVRDYLVNAGIPAARLQAKGYGELNPVADNNNEEGRKTNRRTEFIIVEY